MGCLFPNPFWWGVTLATGQQCEAHDGIIEGVIHLGVSVCVSVCVRAHTFPRACICMTHTENQHQGKTVKEEKVSGAQSTSILTSRIPAANKILMHSAS